MLTTCWEVSLVHDTYFCSMLLGAPPRVTAPSLDAAAESVADWLNDPRRGFGSPFTAAALLQGTHSEPGPGMTVTSLRVEAEGQTGFGVRLDHPDSEEADVFWRTDVILSRVSAEDGELRVSVRVALGSRDDSVAPIQVTHSRPRLVPQLIRRFHAHEMVPLSLTATPLSPDGVNDFVRLLADDRRTLPVVFVSARNWDDRPIVDADQLADQLAGLAHVFVGASRFASRRLGEVIEPRLNCFDGGVRVYWPGLKQTDNPFKHPLWLPERLRLIEESRQGFKGHLLARISRVSLHRFIPGIARWGDLERAHARSQLAQLRAAGNQSEMLELFETENLRLERENQDLNARVQLLEAAAERARSEASAWRQGYEELRKNRPNGSEAAETPIESVFDAVDRVQSEFPDALVIPGKNELDPDFDDPDGLYLALKWLVTIYRDAKRGKASCTDFDQSCRESSGFWYRSHQSKVTMGKHEEDYFVQWKGKKVPLHEHIGTGSNKSSKSTMRIAFFFDDESDLVVVGFLGQHQQTDAT